MGDWTPLGGLGLARHRGAPMATLCFAAKDSLDTSISASLAQEHGGSIGPMTLVTVNT